MPALYVPAIERLEEIVKLTQDDFERFYQGYKERKIALPEFRTFIRTKLHRNLEILDANWDRLYPSLQGVKFVDPRVTKYSSVSVASLNETVKRIIRRYDGLLRYLDVRNEPKRLALGLHNEIVKVVGDLKAIMAEEHVTFEIRGSLTDKFDQTLISLIFQNLIVNSIKYRGRKRTPRFSIRIGVAAPEDIATLIPAEFGDLLAHAGPVACVVYADNGRGIPPDYAEAAFRPFIQVDPDDPSGGSGMGLAIVRSAVESHDGHVWLKSRLGIGTTFFMVIPLEDIANARLSPTEEIRAWLKEDGGLDR
ncbi:hypothetical protein BH10PSE14_BH10PSE14_37700 [soil metagenome]